jgi:hypothetical protein
MSDSAQGSASNVGRSVHLDRRTHARYAFDSTQDGQLVHDGQGEPFPVQVYNLSAGGLAFLADRHIEPLTLLSLDLPAKGARGAQRLVIRVRSVDKVSKDSWRIGCQFSRPLTDIELLALL